MTRLQNFYPEHNHKKRQTFADFPRKRAEQMRKDHKAGDQLKEDELEAQRLEVLLKVLDIKNDDAILKLTDVSDPLSLESFVAHANTTSIQVKNANPGA
jgi:hypothetical protein